MCICMYVCIYPDISQWCRISYILCETGNAIYKDSYEGVKTCIN